MFFANALINLQMLEAARLAGVDRFLSVSTVKVYSSHTGRFLVNIIYFRPWSSSSGSQATTERGASD